MATVEDIVTAAFRECRVASDDESLDATQLANGVDVFNRMLHGWKLRGVDVSHATQSASDTFALDPEYEEGTVFVLAGRLSSSYSSPVGFDADDFFRTLQADYATAPDVTLPSALRRMPSQMRRGGRYRYIK